MKLVELRRDPRKRAALPWTDARIAHLKARWSQGVTAQRIARELGGGISRSAVLGKIHRLGFAELSPRACVSRSHLKRGGGRCISQQLRIAGLPGRIFAGQHWLPPAWVIEAKPYVDDPRVDADIPLAQRRSFLELTDGACRWPVGDPSHPDFFFCGAEALRGELYCAAHRARAYRPAAETIPGAANTRRRRTVRRDHGLDTATTAGRTIADEGQRSGEGG
jgi:GcrA cell cycle regulator